MVGRLMWPLASAVLAVVTLQVASATGLLPAKYFPDVPALATATRNQLGNDVFWAAVRDTLHSSIVGLLIAAGIAIPLGIAIGLSSTLFYASRFLIEFIRPIPSVALIPLLILLYGTGFQTKVVLVVLSATSPILIQAIYGVHDADPTSIKTARSFQVSAARRLLWVILPGALPFIATGVRISASLALLISVSTEVIIGSPGLGREIGVASQSGATAVMYTYILATGVLGIILTALLSRAERRFLSWSVAHRGRA